MKKLILFVVTIALVSSLSATIGCGAKKTSASGTAPTTGAATVTHETKK